MGNKEKLLDKDIKKRFKYEEKQVPNADSTRKKEKRSNLQVIIAVAIALFVLATLLYPLIQMIMDNI
ncbi:MAG: hypothetical protein ABF743_01835 [Schleiferilactobacillus perolens]|jgi:type IV secretory pathway component VirB8|uniref:hypothetical protein n=1 Tax=Schleiferilactobacillus perolens TaxID=100468 RepID=UPI0039EA168E|nr:hypothetical protein [Schleiferilactobacillus harbinensis]MCI1912684.1 hypothetical protein [Schleiferilactobacillus harbinensis]